jgi:hypothetical protein
MIRALIFFLCAAAVSSVAQVRIEKLVIKPNQIYTLAPSDIIVADTLVMMDSSVIRLNELKPENYIRIQVAFIGRNCMIDGRGVNGKHGTVGSSGKTPIGPCKDGPQGRSGTNALDGKSGINLFLYIDRLNAIESLLINLSGGNGGDGGNGGIGGGGSPGTNQCRGGDGGNGGNGGRGGSGGTGGTLTVGGKEITKLREIMRGALIVHNKGGTFGYGGVAGYGGPAGLGPDKNYGKSGAQGIDGNPGKPAENGTVLFEEE